MCLWSLCGSCAFINSEIDVSASVCHHKLILVDVDTMAIIIKPKHSVIIMQGDAREKNKENKLDSVGVRSVDTMFKRILYFTIICQH